MKYKIAIFSEAALTIVTKSFKGRQERKELNSCTAETKEVGGRENPPPQAYKLQVAEKR